MSKKTKHSTAATENLPALRIGSRVRCTDDSVEGRIVWANAVSVKIRWGDGEQVTWRRDSLASKPIEILEPADDGVPTEPSAAVPAPQQDAAEPAAPADLPLAKAVPTPEPTEEATVSPMPVAEPAPPAPKEEAAPAVPVGDSSEAPAPAKPKPQRKAPAGPKEKKLSAIDAAARVLAEAGVPMNCQEMIAAMASKGYWSSPNGKTPHATLYSAILREIATKGDQARFTKTERGKFAHRPAA